MSSDTIEREEWLVVMGVLADIRAHLRTLVELVRGEDGEEEDDDA